MKKLLMAVVFIGAVALTSCKKEWTCECTITDSSNNSSTTVSGTTEKMSKKDAKADCETTSTVGTMTTTCKIK